MVYGLSIKEQFFPRELFTYYHRYMKRCDYDTTRDWKDRMCGGHYGWNRDGACGSLLVPVFEGGFNHNFYARNVFFISFETL